jgi:hypothetical protein
LHERYLLDALAVHVEQLAEVGRSRGEAAAQERAYLVKANVGITVLLDRRKATRHFRCVLLQLFFERTCSAARASCGRQISSQKSMKVATLRGASRLDGRTA